MHSSHSPAYRPDSLIIRPSICPLPLAPFPQFFQADGSILKQGIFKVDKLVDTTGAGDCFRAGFAVALVEGREASEALTLGAAASALCVQKMGAMPSMPSRTAVSDLTSGAF